MDEQQDLTRPRGSRRNTIRDVAARAGVSVATVSRVLAGNYPVSADTRARVVRAVTELDYVVNAHARSLAGVGTEAVAILLDDITGPSFAHIARGVEEEASARERLCLVCTTHGDPERELALVDLLRQQRAAAVILVGGAHDLAEYQVRMARFSRSLEAAGSRLVLVGRPRLDSDASATVVDYDNEGGAFAMTSHLLSAGHRRILTLPGAEGLTTALGRLAGYRRALRAHGVTEDPGLVMRGPYSRTFGQLAVREALARDTSFTAVFAGTDMVASGALEGLREAGIDVPGEVSLAGYDDIPLATDLHPKLTTVHVPYEEMGRTAVRLALARRDRELDDHVVLGTHVVVRRSVRSPGQQV
ncbi:LacI family DNA-binding transcriptional regulator [Streptomyces sp. CBMA29]|uniref:LacI family DNA-binding transcriptional regulator n=1 Tax=Streptomyces sp. CBMA29 TaxID=1896314 RepID=UPI001661BC7F|nr:LacI family DNA-binding transcriptional regulator [Streptomyces sp. CBMA29]MBD0735682.1 LacI family transcriptional regulator [Streptomyces sp. CBMA29]